MVHFRRRRRTDGPPAVLTPVTGHRCQTDRVNWPTTGRTDSSHRPPLSDRQSQLTDHRPYWLQSPATAARQTESTDWSPAVLTPAAGHRCQTDRANWPTTSHTDSSRRSPLSDRQSQLTDHRPYWLQSPATAVRQSESTDRPPAVLTTVAGHRCQTVRVNWPTTGRTDYSRRPPLPDSQSQLTDHRPYWLQPPATAVRQTESNDRPLALLTLCLSDKVSNWCPIRYWKFSGDILRSFQVIGNIREGAEYAPPPQRGAG